jgi:hypothetical protein
MTRFIEQAITRAGLGDVVAARQRGDLDAVRRALDAAAAERPIDLLILGALADSIRVAERGNVVEVHDEPRPGDGVAWIEGDSDLELLRAVAFARITSPCAPSAAKIGVDWGRSGLEVAQVALGFGASELTGPITRKSGALIRDDELKKVKGKGMVAATALKRREIAALVRNAGRVCEFQSDDGEGDALRTEVSYA